MKKSIGLALSGGGIRAAVFHLGVLKYLAQNDQLEHINQISTVSGGSLIVGLIFKLNDNKWPTSEKFLHDILPDVEETITTNSLLPTKTLILKRIIYLLNIFSWGNGASILNNAIQKKWGIDFKSNDLPTKPIWWINATSYESGKNWRFSQSFFGDWKFGRNFESNYSISNCLAASAAVPYIIGTLKLKLPVSGWWETDPSTKAKKRRLRHL